MKKILIYLDKSLDNKEKDITKKNILKNNFEITYFEGNDKFKDYKNILTDLQNNKISRAIIIDDFGIAPFMFFGKHKKIVVAEIADSHSARMTMEHNNSNVISLGIKISTICNIIDIINTYLNSNFEGNRHMVRINMLENLLEKE